MDELEAMKAISKQLEDLGAEERERVLAWALSKFGGNELAAKAAGGAKSKSQSASVSTKGAPKPKTGKKSKTVIAMDKSLNLSPSGKKSAVQFAAEKAPSNVLQKCVVAVYYLREFIGLDKVSVSAVYTYFKTLSWPIPADLRNALQKAGSEGWLDTADGDDIKITSMGENVVEHSLPAKTA